MPPSPANPIDTFLKMVAVRTYVWLRRLDVRDLAPLVNLVAPLVNLQSLDISDCKMSDLAPLGLGALLSLQSLDMCGCRGTRPWYAPLEPW
jgi:Leucine-rich repeat (LRR) protein